MLASTMQPCSMELIARHLKHLFIRFLLPYLQISTNEMAAVESKTLLGMCTRRQGHGTSLLETSINAPLLGHSSDVGDSIADPL